MMFKRTTSVLAVVMIVFITGMGFLAGCGESDTQTDDVDTGDLGEEPQATVRDTAEQDTTMQQDQREKIFEATLEGTNQVPEVETKATGNVTVTLLEDSMRVQGGFSGLRGEYVASHIHLGGENENGDPVQPLDPELGEDDRSGNWDEAFEIDEELISALESDSLYVNVHSEEHQGGEIRGQLTTRDAEKGKNTN